MSGWIPVDKDLLDDPRVLEMAIALKNELHLRMVRLRGNSGEDLPSVTEVTLLRHLVTGALVTLWRYADEHLRDHDTLPVGLEALDAIVGIEGFTDLLPEEWLRELDDGRVELPGYSSKNRLINKDKRKSNGAARQKRYRERIKASKDGVTHNGDDNNASLNTLQTVTVTRNASVTNDARNGDLHQDLHLNPNTEEEEKRAQANSNQVPRGTATLSPEAAYQSLLDDWRRDVPECNPEAFARWIVHCEGKGKQLGAQQRLYQARQLAGNGDFTAQAEVIDYCIGKPYYSLIPLQDVRARVNGMSRRGRPAEPTREERQSADKRRLQELSDSRVMRGIPNFRLPYQHESPEAYETAMRLEVSHGPRAPPDVAKSAAQ